MSSIPKMGTCVPKMAGMGGCYCGRRGLPLEAIETMYADYLRLGSLSKAGKIHSRTRQNMFDIFKRRGLKLKARNFKPQIEYRGRKYTLDEQGYYRDTIYRSGKYNDETFLHRRIWTDNNGQIPPGYTVYFKDGDRRNTDPKNLELLSHDEQQQRRGTGRNQFTKLAGAKLKMLVGNFESGNRSMSSILKRRAA